MSQHDFNIANQTFPSFRSDLNDALQAAATISAGATAPTTPYAYQLWFDTSTNTYKARNAANSAWISLFGNDLTNGGVTFGDTDKCIFGAGSDLQIYHDGINSYIDDAGTGGLFIRSGELLLQKYTGEAMIYGVADSFVKLYYDNAEKLATTATGIDVTGTAVTDGLTVAGNVSVDGGTIKLDGNYPVGTDNVALGDDALSSGSLSGNYNVAIGSFSLAGNTTASGNVSIGRSTLGNNQTGSANTAIGSYDGTSLPALYSNTSGSYNTATGVGALATTTASYNTAVGYQAGYTNNTGNVNVFLGRKSGYANNTGAANTYIGDSAGVSMTTGSNNTILGRFSGNGGGLDIRTSSNNIVLSDGDGTPAYRISPASSYVTTEWKNSSGNYAGVLSWGASYDQASTTDGLLKNYSGGDMHIAAGANGVYLANGGTSWIAVSDERNKDIIEPIADAANKVLQLRTVIGKYKTDEEEIRRPFLIAQDVQAVLPEAVTVDTNEDATLGVAYTDIIPLLTAAIKEQQATITALEARIVALES